MTEDAMECVHEFEHIYGESHWCDGCCSLVYEKLGSRETLKGFKKQLTLIQDNPIVENLNGVELAELVILTIDQALEGDADVR